MEWYYGVIYNGKGGFQSSIIVDGEFIEIGDFSTEKEAVVERDRYILKHNLNFPLQVLGKDGSFQFDKVDVKIIGGTT